MKKTFIVFLVPNALGLAVACPTHDPLHISSAQPASSVIATMNSFAPAGAMAAQLVHIDGNGQQYAGMLMPLEGNGILTLNGLKLKPGAEDAVQKMQVYGAKRVIVNPTGCMYVA